MDGGKRVWVPHDLDGFKMGRIVDIGADGITVEPFDSPGKVWFTRFCLDILSLKPRVLPYVLVTLLFDRILFILCFCAVN